MLFVLNPLGLNGINDNYEYPATALFESIIADMARNIQVDSREDGLPKKALINRYL
jgi:hypothetical protein